MHKALRTSATIDSLFTTFSPSKREILFPEMILFFFFLKKKKGGVSVAADRRMSKFAFR